MSRIRGKNTKPEVIVRKLLTAMGIRYRLHVKKLPGRPDVVIGKRNAVIFVHGCFWHCHKGCRDGRIPKSTYWQKKLLGNQARDKMHLKNLQKDGWKVLTLWECRLEKRLDNSRKKIERFLQKVGQITRKPGHQ
jgi:DNA mismatch endonuclease (patch repair protein)